MYETSVVSFVFNHERIEGSSLTEWQTRTVFETRDTVLADSTTPGNVRETANHTKMFDFLFDSLDRELTPEFIKEIHLQLMAGVMDVPGQWKILGNGVGSVITARPEEVPTLIDRLVSEYNKYEPSLENIVRFHVRFETIHPFPDGNGRVGRAIAFRECLRAGLVPFIVTDASKETYYTSLDEFRAGVPIPLISYAEAMQVDFASTIAPMLADRSLSDSLLGKLGIERPDFKDDAGFVGPSTKSLKSSLDSVGKTGSEIKSDHKTHRTRRV
ncbi:MAG: Fic family protein [Adlercreutzia sp.]|nr:Fic family protein [Adlercreutzia sp.]